MFTSVIILGTDVIYDELHIFKLFYFKCVPYKYIVEFFRQPTLYYLNIYKNITAF